MGRYVGNTWHEELPSSGPADQQQGNSVPVSSSSSSGGGGGGGGSAPATTIAPGAYSTVNGPRTLDQMAQELAAVGYGGPTDSASILSTYGRTTGQSVQPIMNTTPGGTGAVTAAGAPVVAAANNTGANQLAAGINQLLAAIASGNKQAFDETVREFNANFGLDTQKFQESVRQYNENLAISQAGLTGTYQGLPTQQAQLQAANIAAQQAKTAQDWASQYGYVPQFDANGNPIGVAGQPASTLAAQNQAYTQQLGAINAAAALQANPFRQQQVIGQLGRVLTGQGVAGFSAPNTVTGVGTAGGNTQGGFGYMNQIIADIQNPGANDASVKGVLDAIPTPNKINSADFLRSSPSTQNMILQGMQEKYGLDPNDSLAQIKNTLPQFTSPSTFGTIKG